MRYIYIILSGITFLCIYIIGCVGLNIFPALGYAAKADSINIVLLNLSYSYIAGWIFYLFITYFPYYIQKKKFSSIINNRIEELCKQIETCIETFGSNDQNIINTIKEERLLDIIIKSNMYSNSYFAQQVGFNITNLQFLVDTRKNCFDIIEKLIIYKEYLTTEQIVSIEKIRDSAYFHLIKIYPDTSLAKEYYNSDIFKKELVTELYTIILLLRKIKKEKC